MAGGIRHPRVRLGLVIAAFLLVTVVTWLIAYPKMFTGFAWYDDEGYMLIALQSFLHHGHLYDDVFTQYGPFYYEAWGAVFSVLGIPVSHDGGRTVTAVAWVLSSLMFGLGTARMARSVLLGLATQVVVFVALWSLATEPMHPGGIICLLLAVVVLLSCAVRTGSSPGAMALLGGAIAALILVKINVGAFALIALGLVCAVSYDALKDRQWVRGSIEALFIAVPFLLMASRLDEAWARHYAAHVALSALAVVLVLRVVNGRRRPSEELLWLAGGVAGLTVASVVVVFVTGTTLEGLIDGLIRQPLRQADAFSLPLPLSNQFFVLDLIGLGSAMAYCYVSRGDRPISPGWVSATSILVVLVGLEMALSTVGKALPYDAGAVPGFQFSMLPFVWMALIPLSPNSDPATSFARLLLPPLAVLQALHAFPVAGSQGQWSVLLLIPVGAVCVANGLRSLVANLEGTRERQAMIGIVAISAVVLGGFFLNSTLRSEFRANRAVYNASVPLDLPGAHDVRLSQTEAETYRAISSAINSHCESFVMLPGMNSFYLWTGQEPPTGFNATGWPTLFDDEHQRRVIDEVRQRPGLCLLKNEGGALFWSGGSLPASPLVRFMKHNFQPLLTIGDYQLMKRRNARGIS